MEFVLENRDRTECTYIEIVVDAYVHVLYRERASEELFAARFGDLEPLASDTPAQEAIAD